MKRVAWYRYISIGMAIVGLCAVAHAQEAQAPPLDGPAQTPSAAPIPLNDPLPNLEINIPPPPDGVPARRRNAATRSSPQNPPTPRVFTRPGEATPLSDQWTVSTPHGTMTHTLEATPSEDGLSIHRQHAWTAPDGTLLRSQQTDITTTGPNNYQRQRTITLRDGRTVEHTYTRSWDGQTFHTEQSFSGPNGQTWTRERTWTPGAEDAPAQPTPQLNVTRGPVVGPSPAPAPTEPTSGPRAMTRLGLGKNARGLGQTNQRAARPWGFTVRALGRGGWTTAGQGPTTRPPTAPEAIPSLAKRLRGESAHLDRPGSSRPSGLPRPRAGR